jgi:hypothetical protein
MAAVGWSRCWAGEAIAIILAAPLGDITRRKIIPLGIIITRTAPRWTTILLVDKAHRLSPRSLS